MYYKVNYIYRGNKLSKLVEASTKLEASSLVKKEMKNVVVIGTEQSSAPIEEIFKDIGKNLPIVGGSKLREDDKIAAIRQIAVMTDAGIPIHDVLEDIVRNSKQPALKEVFSSVTNDINAGKSMSKALEPFSDKMGHIVMAMTTLGEKTGNFPEAYHKLADILESIRDNKQKFKKAMRYPIMVILALIIAFVAVIMMVVPQFRKIFESLNADLPAATKFLLAAESFFSAYGIYILVFIVAFFFFIKYKYRNDPGFKYMVDKFISNRKLYLIGEIVYLSNIYNYTLVFGSLIKAGIPVSEALETASGVVDNMHIRKKLDGISANIGRGVALSEAFEDTGLFEDMSLQMIRAGEASGQLDAMFDKVKDYYNMKFQNLIDNLSAYIEPIMIFMIAGLVLLLALGIFMPMWDLGKAAKG